MKAKITLHIYAKSTKANAASQLPIYVRLTIDGQRLEFSTKKFVEPAKWSAEQSKMKGSSEEACSINNYLNLLKSKIFDIQMELVHKNQPFTIAVFKNKLSGIEERPRLLIPIFQDHNNKVKSLVGQEFAAGTLERYETSQKHTQAFIQWKYYASDIDIRNIDHAFINEYEYNTSRTLRK